MLASLTAAALGMLLIGASWIALFLIPGLTLASAATQKFHRTSTLVGLTLGVGLAVHVVPALLFVVAAVLTRPIDHGIALSVAALILAARRNDVLPALQLARRALAGARAFRSAPAAHLVVAGASLFVFGAVVLSFDTLLGFHFDCIYHPVALAAGWQDPGNTGLANPSLYYSDHQRLGVSQVLAPAMALFDYAGLRMQWGALFALIPPCLYIVARRLAISRTGAAFGALASGTLPSLMGYADQNRVVLSTTALLALALSLRAPVTLLAGALAGLIFAEEPAAALGLLAAPAALALHPEPRFRDRRAIALFLCGLAAFIAPAIARYKLAFGHFLYHEHFSYMPPLPYRFLGIDFSLHAFFNWPLHDHLVRSPFNGLPNLALVPLSIMRQLSVPLSAVVLVGLLTWVEKKRLRLLLVLGLSFLPVAALLALNENWVEREKNDIIMMAYMPLLLALCAGADRLAHWPPARAAVVSWLASLVLVLVTHRVLSGLSAPEDLRLREAYAPTLTELPTEDNDYLRLERSNYAQVPWLPVEHFSRAREALDLRLAYARAWVDELADRTSARRRFQRDAGARPSDGGGRDIATDVYAGLAERKVRIDLSLPPSQWIHRFGESARAPACAPDAPAAIVSPSTGPLLVEVTWNHRPIRVWAMMAPRLRAVSLGIFRTELRQREASWDTLPRVNTSCIEFRFPDTLEVRLHDKMSVMPNRVYVYSLTPDPERADGARLTLLE